MTTTNFFGPGVDTSIFSPDTLGVNRSLRCCVGKNIHPGIRWYGFNGVRPETLSFCEHCAKIAFRDDEIFEVTDVEYPGLKSTLVCDSKNAFIKQYVGERRCVKYNDINYLHRIFFRRDLIFQLYMYTLRPHCCSYSPVRILHWLYRMD